MEIQATSSAGMHSSAAPGLSAASRLIFSLLLPVAGAASLHALWNLSTRSFVLPGKYFFCIVVPALFLAQTVLCPEVGRKRPLLDGLAWLYFPVLACVILFATSSSPDREIAAISFFLCAGLRSCMVARRFAMADKTPGWAVALKVSLFVLVHHACLQAWNDHVHLAPPDLRLFPFREAVSYSVSASVLSLILFAVLSARIERAEAVRAATAATFLLLIAPQVFRLPLLAALFVCPFAFLRWKPVWSPESRTRRIASTAGVPCLTLWASAAVLSAFYFPEAADRVYPWKAFAGSFRDQVLRIDRYSSVTVLEMLIPFAGIAAGAAAGLILPGQRCRKTRVALLTLSATVLASLAVSGLSNAPHPEILWRGVKALSAANPRWETGAFSPREIRGICIISGAAHTGALEQGRTLARIIIEGRDGPAIPLRLGLETAEWSLERRDVAEVARHEMARVASSYPVIDEAGRRFAGHRYLARIVFPAKVVAVGLKIEFPARENLPEECSLVLHEVRILD